VGLTPLRWAGLSAAVVFAVASVWAYRRGRIGNGDLLLRFLVFVLPLLAVSLEPGVFTWVLDQFSFKKGARSRTLGATIVAVGVLYAFTYLLATRQERTRRDLTRLIENLALEQFRLTTEIEQFAGAVAIVIPAYNEASNITQVLASLPEEVSGLPVRAIVVDDGSADDTTEVARVAGAAAAVRLPMNRGGGAAVRTGYSLALATGARVVVTMDADGQHQASELPRLIDPIIAGEVDVVSGSRVLGAADPNHPARELGIKVFAWLLSALTASRVTDPSCGYRAVRAEALRELELYQDQFHVAEFLLEASKRKLTMREVPVTVTSRLSGTSKKPPRFRYGVGFANALLRAWLR
jgi:hypothetical protein